MKQKLLLLLAIFIFSLATHAEKMNKVDNDYNAATYDSTTSVPCIPPTNATLTGSTLTLCNGSSRTITITGTLNDATEWKVYSGSCGGTLVTSTSSSTFTVSPSTTTTYYVRGEGGCVTPGTCASFTVTVSSAINTGSWSQTNIACKGSSTGSATITPSGGTAPYTYSWSPSGGTGATASGLTAGTYVCTITDDNTCTTTKSVTITEPAAPLSATTSQTNVSCFGGSNGTASVVVSGGTGTKYYYWSPSGGTGATASGLAAGTYTCTIYDDYECYITKTFTITAPTAALTATTASSSVACFGGANGVAGVSASGGTGAKSYSWSPSGGNGAWATGLTARTYTCTITDANGCSISKSVIVTEPTAALTATGSQTNVACFGGSNGTATVVTSGGTGPKTYSWSPSGGTGASASGLTAGTYICTIYDDNYCSASKSFTITEPTAALTATGSQTNVSCYGGSNGTATVVASGGTGTKTYSWSPSGGTGASASGLAAGTYTCTIYDDNSCSASKSFTITDPTALTATTSTSPVSCFGGSNGTATVVASGGTGTKTYSWSPSGGTGASASGRSAGTYTCTISDGNGCSISKSVTITEPTAALTATGSQTNVACYGGSNGTATVVASGGTGTKTYSWSPSGGTGASASGLTAGSYQCYVYDDKGCSASKSFTITEPTAALTATGSQTNVSCYGGSNGSATVVTSGGTGTKTYSWSPSGGTGATASGLAAGTYTCTIYDDNYCSASKSFTITEPTAALTATGSQTPVSCFGGSNGTATVVASGGTGTKTYSWSPSGGTGATASGLAAGTYTCTITDGNSCTTAKSFTITQPAVLTSSTSTTNVSCNGGSNGTAVVNASGGTAPYTYSWSPTGGQGSAATGLSLGTYTCTITDAKGCTTSATAAITQPAVLSASTSQISIACNGSASGSATVNVTGGTGAKTYSWSPSGGTGATANGLVAGTYTCTITDENYCSITKSVTITQPSALTATTSQNSPTCYGGYNGTATVTVSGGASPYSYIWSPLGGTAATASGLGSGTYTCTITDDNMCSLTKTFTITEPDEVSVSATPASEIICSGSTTGINIIGSPSAAAFSWTVAPVSGTVSGASAGEDENIQQELTGNGVIKYTVTPTLGGCTGSSIDVLVTVNALSEVVMQPTDKMIDEEENTSFAVEADHATGYQWQVDGGDGFMNISDNSIYSGSSTAQLNIIHAPASLGGFMYRCKVTGNCAPVNSAAAMLTVRVRAIQTITFAATDEKTYGDADYTPSATSDAELTLNYSSSNENVATIVDGKIHIINAGQTTITASQPGNNNYKPATDVSQLLTIVPKNITATLNSNPAIYKIYDGTTKIILDAANYSLNNIVANDDVTVSGTAIFETSDAGTGKKVTVDDFVLEGESKTNYHLTNTTADITGTIGKKDITVSLLASPLISKTYDGNKNIALASSNYSINGLLENADVTVTGTATFDDKKAGTDKTITVSALTLAGTDKNNYQLTATTATVTGNIERKEITVELSETPVISKQYNGNSDAELATDNYMLQDIISGDEVAVTGLATYDNRHVGAGKEITVNHFTLNGTDNENYTLTTTEAVIAGNITTRKIKVSLQLPVISKEYDGTVTANIEPENYVVEGILSGDDIDVIKPAVGEFDNRHGGVDKKITVTDLALIGEDLNNYELEATSINANIGQITARPIVVAAASGTKVYGATEPVINYVAEGILEGDALLGQPGRDAGTDVGTYATTTGSLSGGSDYSISEFISSSFTITPAALTITAENKTKLQGAENPVFSFRYEGWVNGDGESVLISVPKAHTSATVHSPIGYYDITASDASASNYLISYGMGRLSVVPSGSSRVKAWASSSSTIEVRIQADVAQKSAITLFTTAGVPVQIIQKKLIAGSNSLTIYVTNLARELYIINVSADKFKEAARVPVK